MSGLPSGGTVTRSGSLLTYSFTGTAVGPAVSCSLTVTGLTNTTEVGSYSSSITTSGSDGTIDLGTTPALTITGGPMSNLTWSSSSSESGAGGVDYTFGFETRSADTLVSVTMTVPPGTGGTPAVGTVSGVPNGGAVALAGNTLTYSFAATEVGAKTTCSVEVTGLTNTTASGTYSSAITTDDANGAVDSGTSPSLDFTGTLAAPSWSASSYESADTGVSYSFGFTTASSAALVSATMTLPTGTTGTPSLLGVSGLPSGGTVTRSGSLLTYSFAATAIGAGTAISLTLGGIRNTTLVGGYTSTITTNDANGAIDIGTTESISITGGPLTSLSWTPSSTTPGASGVVDTFGFKTRSSDTLVSVTMTVPAGTAGTPAVGTVSGLPSGGTISLAGSTLTYSFTGTEVPAGTACSLQVTNLTNSSQAGTYSADVTTNDANGAVDSGTTPSVDFTGPLTALSWSASSYQSAETPVSYTFGFTTASSATLVSVMMTLPTGTTGTPSLLSVSGLPSGGTIGRGGTTLTYSFTGTLVSGGTAVSIVVGSLTNTTTVGSYASSIVTNDVNGAIDLGTTPSFGITGGPLSSVTWTASSTTLGATGVSYTFGFTTRSDDTLVSVTMTVPAGTGGTPALGTVSGVPAGGTFSLSDNTLTYSFTGTEVAAGTVCSVEVTGLTNTPTPGAYTSVIATEDGSGAVDTGAAGLGFGNILTATVPASLAWSSTLAATTRHVVDKNSSDQELVLSDETGTGAGWSIAISATTFTDGSYQLPDSGTFSLNGSTRSATSSLAPTATCVGSCTLPTNGVSYPVAITTAASSPPEVQIYEAAVGTGMGEIDLGGSSAADPVGWWLAVPADAYAGTYTSTVTIDLSSGP